MAKDKKVDTDVQDQPTKKIKLADEEEKAHAEVNEDWNIH